MGHFGNLSIFFQHRRKKERSSLFFRKKKDKAGINNSSTNVNGKPTSIQHHALFEAQQVSKKLWKNSEKCRQNL